MSYYLCNFKRSFMEGKRHGKHDKKRNGKTSKADDDK